MGKFTDQAVLSLDRLLTKIQLQVYERKGCLLSLFFHGLFTDNQEARNGKCDPQQAITVSQFEQIIEYFLGAGYQCASPLDILRGLDPKRRYFALTFDDGYFNNSRALPVLEKLKVTAMFFISAAHVEQGKAYWWDILYRLQNSAGSANLPIQESMADLKRMTSEEVDRVIERSLGAGAWQPVGELDRPFTPAELREFARNDSVFIGNHTYNHAILTNYAEESVVREITQAQQSLEKMTGCLPLAVAYPNGNFTRSITKMATSCGLKLGFTTQPRKDYASALRGPANLMTLGRLCPYNNDRLIQQCEYFRSDLAFYERFHRLKDLFRAN